MPRFRYEALTNTGGTVKSVQDANSRTELVYQLKAMGYWPLDIVEDDADETGDKQFQLPLFSSRVKAKDVEFFYISDGDTDKRPYHSAARFGGYT